LKIVIAVFSAFNIAIANVYMFLAFERSSHARKAKGIVHEISRSAAADWRLKMRRGNVLSLTKDDWRTTLLPNKHLSKRQGVRRGKPPCKTAATRHDK
jgi:hypothetical protein